MEGFTVFLVEAFSYCKKGGNTAGVVLDADVLTRGQKQSIASQVGVSETAFVSKGEKGKSDFSVSFFTPTEEVDLCGHATMAAFWLLKYLGRISVGCFTQETKAGVLAVRIDEDERITMNQTLPKWLDVYSPDAIAPLFGLQEGDLLVASMPIQALSTGLADIIVPVSAGMLEKAIMNERAVVDFCRQESVIGFHLFELASDDSNITAYCRNFAPVVGIPEESATGSASGALACYLYKQLGLTSMCFEQGRAMNKPSRLWADLTVNQGNIAQVQVSGMAFLKSEYALCVR